MTISEEQPLYGTYILPHAEPEMQRLDTQHYMLVKFLENEVIAEEAVPHLQKVAQENGTVDVIDVATGTGIWLQTAHSHLSQLGIPANLYGYDMSDEKFPKEAESAEPSISFGTWNVMNPPPEQLKAKFDYVHVRLLMGGLDHDQWDRAAANMTALLKPGGYFDWTDIVSGKFSSRPITATSAEIIKQVPTVFGLMGKDPSAAANIAPLLAKHDIIIERDFQPDGYPRDKELQKVMNGTQRQVVDHFISLLFEKAPEKTKEATGWKSLEEVKELLGKLKRETDEEGVELNFPLVRVIGRSEA